MNSSKILVVKNLKKYFSLGTNFFGKTAKKVKAIDGVCFEIERGETLGLVGESGCGKSTLGRCVMRLVEPTEGEIIFEQKDICKYNQEKMRIVRRNMQMIFQDPFSSLDPRKPILKIIGEGFDIHGMYSKNEQIGQVKELMDIVGLMPEHINRYPHEFSGGQRQRICVARALSLKPKFIIADEPVSALDVSIQAQILNLFVNLQQKFSLTYLFITHDLSVVRHISNRIAVMYLGRIVEITDNVSLFHKPIHPYTKALISAIPVQSPLNRKERNLIMGDIPSPINPPSGCTFHPRCERRKFNCVEEVPTLKQVSNNHWVACHFP